MGRSDSQFNHTPRRRYPLSYRSSRRSNGKSLLNAVYLVSIVAIGALTTLFFSGQLVLGGVPSSIIMTFLQDKTARDAYFHRDSAALHDRLQVLGVEEQIKAYYRPQIHDEVELDRYIHQLLYDRTGYVGSHYRLNSEGRLVLKQN
jgi:hypothetical protein